PKELGLQEKSENDLRLEGIVRSSDEKTAAIPQPTPGEDEGYYVKVTYTQYGIELSPTENLKKAVAEKQSGQFAHNVKLDDLWELMEDFFTNGWENIPPEEISALTDGEIMSDQDGNVYWHERYQIEDAAEELCKGNTVSLQYGGNVFEEYEGEENAPPAEHQSSLEKEATGEMSQSEADDAEQWPMHHAIANALGGKVKAFDQYRGPYVLVGSEIRGQGTYAPAVPMKGTVRLWVQADEGSEGAFLTVYNEDNEKISEPFHWEDTEGAIDAARSVLDEPEKPEGWQGQRHMPSQEPGKDIYNDPHYEQASVKDAAVGEDKSKYDNHPVIELLWDYMKPQPRQMGEKEPRVRTAWGSKSKKGLVLSIARAMQDKPISVE